MRTPSVSPSAARALTERGEAALLDLRAPADFARGHPADALSLPFSPRGLGARARGALPPDVAVVLLAAGEQVEAATAQLDEAGVAVRGVLDGGHPAWEAAGLPVAHVREVTVDELPRLAEHATVVDVREPLEWTTGHVPGALLIPLGRLRAALASIPRDRPVVAICEAGVRSCTAASILAAAGFRAAHVPGGSSAYRRSGLPLAFPSEEALAR